jgi:hypothetical protein
VVTGIHDVTDGLKSDMPPVPRYVFVGYLPDGLPEEMGAEAQVTHGPTYINVNPIDHNSTEGMEFVFDVYLPFGPRKVHIALHKLGTEPSTNTRIVHIMAELFKVNPERRRMQWLTPPHPENFTRCILHMNAGE